MKKLFALILTICLMATMSVTAFAKETVVMRVTALKIDGTVFVPEKSDFTDFKDGWVAAATYAKNSEWKNQNRIARVVVDLLADWNAEGSLGSSGEGISDGAICFPMNTRITLNMNGYTINRGRTEWDWNGEVIYIREGANVIINDGIITGGNSGNGAGGIHIDGKATVTLNDVHVVGNVADDDHGAGIAIHDDAILTMNGGSLENNIVDGKEGRTGEFFGSGIYVYKSTAILNNVDFIGNQFTKTESSGAAIYATGSEVTVNECLFDGNGIKDDAEGYKPAVSVVHGKDSFITITNSTFTNNGGLHYNSTTAGSRGTVLYKDFSNLFSVDDTSLNIESDCKINNNTVYSLFHTSNNGRLYVSDSEINDNDASVMYSYAHSSSSYFKNCIFSNNFPSDTEKWIDKTFDITGNTLTFEDCDLGDSTFKDFDKIIFMGSNKMAEEPTEEPTEESVGAEGSIVSEGSLTMLAAMSALVISIASLAVAFASKNKTAEKAE